eukprot:12191565-Alexandrium_andersonii.AAC.1
MHVAPCAAVTRSHARCAQKVGSPAWPKGWARSVHSPVSRARVAEPSSFKWALKSPRMMYG